MTDAFWCIPEAVAGGNDAAASDQLEGGDLVLFYLVQTNTEPCFLGNATLDSGWKRLEVEEAKRLCHREFLDCDTGVLLKDINKWEPPLFVSEIHGKGAFSAGHKQFGRYFQGSFKRLNNCYEYETILEEHKLGSHRKKSMIG